MPDGCLMRTNDWKRLEIIGNIMIGNKIIGNKMIGNKMIGNYWK